MILSFQEFLNEEYTIDEIGGKAIDYADKTYNKIFIDEYKKMLAVAKKTDRDFYEKALAILNVYNSKEISLHSMRNKWAILANNEHENDITKLVKPVMDIENKYRTFLMNKYHKDSNLNYEGDETSPYLYHYTSLYAFNSIITANFIKGDSDDVLTLPNSSVENECSECDNTGFIKCDYCNNGCDECFHGSIECDYCFDTEEEYLSAGGSCFSTDGDLFKKGFCFAVDEKTAGIKMKLDFNKIKSDNYKYVLGDMDIGTVKAENEIRILGELKNVKKYLISVEVYPNKLSAKQESFKQAIELLKKHNIKYRIKA
jgi:hypothetical protein